MFNIKVKDFIFIKTSKGFIPAVVKNVDKINSESKIDIIYEDIGLPKSLLRYKKNFAYYSHDDIWILNERNIPVAKNVTRSTDREFIDILKTFIKK